MPRFFDLLTCVVLSGLMLAVGCGDAPTSTTSQSDSEDVSPAVTETDSETLGTPTEMPAEPDSKVEETPEVATVVPAEIRPAEVEEPPVQVLGIGDPAPAIAISQWATGQPVAAMNPEQVYVVEFWATWCPPCRTSMPHISELQEHYGNDVTFIGVTREDLDTVEEFLEKEQSEGKLWRDVVKYRLAIDQEDKTSDGYMRAAQQSGIPTAFIVGKDQRIEWIGHPMRMEAPLEQVVAGTWDREKAIADGKRDAAIQAGLRTISSQIRGGEWNEALSEVEKLKGEFGPSSQLLRIQMYIYNAKGDVEKLNQVQGEFVEMVWDEPMELNQFAWGLAMSSKEEGQLELALKAAQRAVELTEEKEASILDTLARVHFVRGDVDQAITLQKKAIELSEGEIPELVEALQEYEEAKNGPAEKSGDNAEPSTEEPATETPKEESSNKPAEPAEDAAPAADKASES